MVRIEPNSDDDSDGWEVRRIVLDYCYYDKAENVLSDNKYHQNQPAWFDNGDGELQSVADCMGIDRLELIRDLCSDDPIRLASGYRMIGDYHGWDNLDSYPETVFDRGELEKRFAIELA